MDSLHVTFDLKDRSYMSLIKKDIFQLISENNFSNSKKGEIDIVLSEMMTNVMKHSGSEGQILIKSVYNKEIEIICIDNGVGISNLPMVMKDGYSNSGTLGQGLGAIQRLSDEFDIYSADNWGTIILSRFFGPNYDGNTSIIRGIVVPVKGEKQCGDRWAVKVKGDKYEILVSDGLGHGKEAQAASEAIEDCFMKSSCKGPEFLEEAHYNLTRTRGVVAALLNVSITRKQMTFTGIGNIMCRISSRTGTVNAMSYNGIIGHSFPSSLKTNIYTLAHGDRIIICSDGIISRWDEQRFPNVFIHDGALAAAAIYKDFNRGNDDVLVLIINI
jgi:anti-sigma regulatory factor (Ser/Thr protein kinase)